MLAALLAAQTGHSHEQAVYALLEEEGEIRRQMFEEFVELRRRHGEEFDHALELQRYVFEMGAALLRSFPPGGAGPTHR